MNTRSNARRMLVFAAGLGLVVMTSVAATWAGRGRSIGPRASALSSQHRPPADKASPPRRSLEFHPARAAAGAISERFVRAGTAIDLEVVPGVVRDEPPAGTLRVGDDVTIRFRISDAATGRPITGAKPAAWLAARTQGRASGPRIADAQSRRARPGRSALAARARPESVLRRRLER